MVNPRVAAQPSDPSHVHGSAFESFPAHETRLGSLKILRALPIRKKRLVGPWCFLDRFGPLSFNEAKPMDVAPLGRTPTAALRTSKSGQLNHGRLPGDQLLRKADLFPRYEVY